MSGLSSIVKDSHSFKIYFCLAVNSTLAQESLLGKTLPMSVQQLALPGNVP